MTNLTKAVFNVERSDGTPESAYVQFNPNSLSFEKSPKIAEIAIPGLDSPLRQFVRGQSETLTVELFFDSTDFGTGSSAVSVTTISDKFYSLIKIDPTTHATPICTFQWGTSFPGDSLSTASGRQRRTSFRGVVTKVKQEYALFSPDGIPLRNVMTLTMEEYAPLDDQLRSLGLESADHTKSHVVTEGETMASIAGRCLDQPRQWRTIARANGITDPRRLAVGTPLVVPPLEVGS